MDDKALEALDYWLVWMAPLMGLDDPFQHLMNCRGVKGATDLLERTVGCTVAFTNARPRRTSLWVVFDQQWRTGIYVLFPWRLTSVIFHRENVLKILARALTLKEISILPNSVFYGMVICNTLALYGEGHMTPGVMSTSS